MTGQIYAAKEKKQQQQQQWLDVKINKSNFWNVPFVCAFFLKEIKYEWVGGAKLCEFWPNWM